MGMVDINTLYPNGVPSLSIGVDAHYGGLTGINMAAYSAYNMQTDTWEAINYNNLPSITNLKELEKPMVKYYKVVKDHPVYEVGAILQNSGGGDYSPTDDLFVKDVKGMDWTPCESKVVVENTDWFERVYKVDTESKIQYLSKTDAQAAQTATTTSDTPSA